MTAPLFHLSPGALDDVVVGSVVRLDGPEGHHAATVMRLQPGEEVLLSDTAFRRVAGVVVSAERGELGVEVREVSEEVPTRPMLVLVQALAKDKRDLQAVESATELGVDRILPWEAERSVARWKAGREAKKHAEWVSTARAAAKQTRRASIPVVEELRTTAQYLQAVAPRIVAGEVGVIVLHEVEQATLSAAVGEICGRDAAEAPEELHLLVGPEGGISEREVQRLLEAGARSARLGPTVLRSSTAGPAALAAVQLMLGRWD